MGTNTSTKIVVKKIARGVLGLLVASIPALAHHGNAGYDMSKMTVFQSATITQVLWANPHCQISFDVKDEKGKVQHWIVEAPPPADMTDRTWTRKSLNAGDQVTVYLHAAKNGSPVGIMQKVIFPDGKTHMPILTGQPNVNKAG